MISDGPAESLVVGSESRVPREELKVLPRRIQSKIPGSFLKINHWFVATQWDKRELINTKAFGPAVTYTRTRQNFFLLRQHMTLFHNLFVAVTALGPTWITGGTLIRQEKIVKCFPMFQCFSGQISRLPNKSLKYSIFCVMFSILQS